MQSLGDLINSPRSNSLSIFQRRDRWVYACEHCGQEVEATEVGQCFGRGSCQCEGAVLAREREAEARYADVLMAQELALKVQQERYALVGALASQTFETFDRSLQPKAYDTALSFFDHPRSMVFAGKTNGLGKTHLMAAIANRCIVEGRSVRFGTVAEFLAQIRATYNKDAETRTDHYLEQLTHSYLLCVDDLGKENLNPWATEQLFLIVNARYNLRPQGHMILTSNAEGPELALSMGLHNWSRLQEIGEMVYMKGTDYRLRRKK